MEYKRFEKTQELEEASKGKQILLFNHSNSCPISSRAMNEVNSYLDESQIPIYIIIVQDQQELSNEISELFDVEHESPQLILIEDEKAKSVLNHGSITLEKIREIVSK